MKKTALLIISIIMMWMAQANEFFLQGSPLFGLFTFVPLMYFLSQIRDFRSVKKWGMVYGVLFTLTSYFWLINFGDFAIWTLSGVAFVYFLYYSAFFQIIWWIQKTETRFRVLFLSLAWLLFEYFRSSGYLAFPWNLAAHPFHSQLDFIQLADIGGVWLISFIVLFFEMSISEILLSRFPGRFRRNRSDLANRYRTQTALMSKELERVPKVRSTSNPTIFVQLLASTTKFFDSLPGRNFLLALIFLLANITYGQFALVTESIVSKNPEKSIDLILIQQNRDSWRGGSFDEILSELIDLSDQNRSPDTDLIIWSETSLRRDYERSYNYFQQVPSGKSLGSWLRSHGTPLLTGAPVISSIDPFHAHNGAQLIEERKGKIQWYGKLHLIPFAEQVPFHDFEILGDFLENVVGIGRSGWSYGPGYSQFKLNENDPSGNLQFATPICFEDSFPEICRQMVLGGAEVLVNLTNNAWSKTLSAQMQHFIAARFRAVENRRPLVRSTNGGLTSIVLANGQIQSSIPMFEQAVLEDTLRYGNRGFTTYSLLGDYVIWIAALIFLGTLIRRNSIPFIKNLLAKKTRN